MIFIEGREVDVEARAALWRSGLDYGHGTGKKIYLIIYRQMLTNIKQIKGHGIGYFLSVHESINNLFEK